MKNNLVIGCVGPTSLHKSWITGENRNFDLFLVYYGDGSDAYKFDAEYYHRAKGTKFNIVADLDIPDGYEYIFIPDDDLYIKTNDINRLFSYAKEFNLEICQPSLVGYYSIFNNLHHPGYILRYTDYVEIICPCFSSDAFQKCHHIFNYNKSCWGIEKLWDKELGHPKDKIAIVDDVIAVHTRPCFTGDNYSNNEIENPWKDIGQIVDDHQLTWTIHEYDSVKKDLSSTPHHERCYPPLESIEDMCNKLFKESKKQFLI